MFTAVSVFKFRTNVEQGLFEVKKGVRSCNDGVMITTTTTKVTGIGQLYFVNKLLQKCI